MIKAGEDAELLEIVASPATTATTAGADTRKRDAGSDAQPYWHESCPDNRDGNTTLLYGPKQRVNGA